MTTLTVGRCLLIWRMKVGCEGGLLHGFFFGVDGFMFRVPDYKELAQRLSIVLRFEACNLSIDEY
jgi:hypothetical protein